tara:strand:- start:119 stop:529 length:411 start_codon:yes stop_codon:yes gene_type:complete
MSGDTVIGLPLQFTNDNKRAYANSGLIDIQNTSATYLLLDTNSEYIVGHFQCYNGSNTSEQIQWDISFNDILIIRFNQEGRGSAYRGQGINNDIIIPPFTQVKVTGTNTGASSAVNGLCVFAGKVGMAQRVGNLND